MSDAYREVFLQEAGELLAELEEVLLELEQSPGDMDLVARAFRALHTIKGSGAMFGFDDVAAFTHEVETAFDRVRNGEAGVTPELIELGLRSRDHIRALLEGRADPGEAEAILAGLKGAPATPPAGDAPAAPQGPAAEPGEPASPAVYRIRFVPPAHLWLTGTDPLRLLGELRELGECRVVCHADRVPALEDLDPENCYLTWDVVLRTDRGENAVRDVFLFVEDESDLRIERIAGVEEDDDGVRRIGDILIERGDISAEDLRDAVAEQKRLGEILVEKGKVTPSQVASALAEQEVVRKGREAPAVEATVRVSAGKLDRLVDLVGELVIAQARLARRADTGGDPELLSISEEMERLTTELRDTALNIRMMPIGTTFSRFRRLVRDLSAELGKDVALVTEGAETELDKTVIERLGDPLVHLIRNSLDHGIEPPEEREREGKPRQGTVRLAARHAEANVVIEITDDGRGLDPEAIRAKAVERGLLAPDARPSDRELFDLVFEPGFSTAKAVSNVSGRGVGMDVVRRSIEALRGTVELESRPGEGTRVVIRLPLTLAIIEGLLVETGGSAFVVPLDLVEECVELGRTERERARGRRFVEVRGHLVPYVRLRDWFGLAGEPPEREQIVIVDLDGTRFGLVADQVVGQHQTVIKTLGRVYRHVEGLSGATILGDGSVALILDPQKIHNGAAAEAA